MYLIYIDSSKRYEKKIVLTNSNGEVLEEVAGDIDIVNSIKKVLELRNISIRDVMFDFNKGPGESFTGLKVGAVITNILNWANGNLSVDKQQLPNYGRDPNISERKLK